MKSWLKKNWKTTAAGVITLAATALAGYQNPGILADPKTIAAITSGLGLIVAADSNGSKPAAQ